MRILHTSSCYSAGRNSRTSSYFWYTVHWKASISSHVMLNMTTLFILLLIYIYCGFVVIDTAHAVCITSSGSALSQLASVTANRTPANEYAALYDIFAELNGLHWLWGLETTLPGIPWNFTSISDPCFDKWQGVNCTLSVDGESIHVTELCLSSMNLSGSIPNSINQLLDIQIVALDVNFITGTLPKAIGNLTQLLSLSVGSNLLEGHIPDFIGNLVNLTELGLSSNLFTGPLPDLSRLTRLVTLDVGANELNGDLPAYFGNFTNLQLLVVQKNQFTGSLHDSLGRLSQLRRLVCNNNRLTGTIPASLGQLKNMTRLVLYTNMLTGQIPDSLGGLPALQMLLLYGNHLRSTVPSSLGALRSLTTLSLQSNALYGTLPRSLCNATALTALRAQKNQLTGTLPACLTLNPAFAVLVLYNNHLSGPLPAKYANGSALDYFDLNSPNAFTGTLPVGMSNLRSLGSIYIGGNLLSGPIPASFGTNSALVTLYVNFNKLSGTLPAELGTLAQLQLMEFSGNGIFGSLPPSWSSMRALQELHADANFLSGPIPSSYTTLQDVQVLNLFKNMLSGTIPDDLGELRRVQDLGLDSNMLTGTLPASVGSLSSVQNLELYNNRLTGTLPSTLLNLTSLVNLLVQNNRLSGSLDEVFDSAVQVQLATVQLSDNQFTGTLPDESFRMPSLVTFAAVSNCFQGSLPRSLCGSSTVQVLALSGLQSAKACQLQLLPGLAESYIIKKPIEGGIPSCLYEIPSLTTLQLSGNGLSGTLPGDIDISASLRDLSLSHNYLSGTIPDNFQLRAWSTFDASHNRLSGGLQRGLESQSSAVYNLSDASSALFLENNRLSGRIPVAARAIVNISLLSGNLFGCDLDQSDLPPHDSAASNYQCGSTTFEVPYYVWLAVLGCVGAVAVWLHRSEQAEDSEARRLQSGKLQALQQVRAWYLMLRTLEGVDAAKSPMLNLRYVSALYNSVSKLAGVSAAYVVFVLLPVYCVLSTYYGTVDQQYAYTVAAAFFAGTVPLALELLFLVLLQCLVVACCVHFWQARDARVVQRQQSVAPSEEHAQSSSLLNRVAVYYVLLLVNTAVVFGINIAYVYIALYESSGLLLFAQIVLSVFKLGWNKFCGSSLIPLTARFVSPSVSSDLRASSVEFFPLQLFLSLFNNIAIPCLVVMIVSPNCFSYVFTHSPAVTSTYTVNQCLVQDDANSKCDSYYVQLESTRFDPPFTYTYQCSASFVTYYAPAYVIMCIMSTFGIPALQSAMVALHSRAVDAYTRTGRLAASLLLLDAVLPSILKPPGFVLLDLAQTESDRQSVLDMGRWTTVQRNIYAPHFPASQVLLNMLTFLGILLTFGAVFPPLAATLAVTVLGVAVYARLKVGRFLIAALAAKQYRFLDLVDQECRGVGSLHVLLRSAFMLLAFSCAFYTMFLFDTYGEKYGVDGAYWVLVVPPAVPIVLFAIFKGCGAAQSPPAPALISVDNIVKSSSHTAEVGTKGTGTGGAAGQADWKGADRLQAAGGSVAFNALHDDQL